MATFDDIAAVMPSKQLFSSVLHELQQPLVAIRLFAANGRTICEGGAASAAALDTLFEGIGESAEMTIRTIGRMRGFVNGQAPSVQATDVNEAVAEVLRLAEIVARARDITIVEALEPGLDCVWADRGALQQAVLNLVFNAIEAIDAEVERRITVSTCSAGDAIEIVVADTGYGIPEKLHDKLFEPAFTTKPQGSGLGLVIARDIITQHGGSIELLESKPGKGSRFCITLPVTLPA
jgi:two-component system C4-dicarboxylate transport sensor histidine kinase DctB